MLQSGRRLLALHLSLATAACASTPRRVELNPTSPVPPRQEVEVWRGRDARTLHGVALSDSLLSGVPLHRAPACDSCRITIPLAEVDSLRYVSTERNWMILAAIPFVMIGVLAGAWAIAGGND
jgi:hypothetical protein